MQNENEKKKLYKKILIGVIAFAGAVAVFFAGFLVHYLTLDEGLRSLLWYKDMIEKNYYWDLDDDDFWNAAIDGVTGTLDPYSDFYTADEFLAVQEESTGRSVGVGLSFFSGSNTVAVVSLGSPSFFAGIRAGMSVTGVGKTEADVVDTFTSAALTEAFSDFGEGDTVCLRLSAAGSAETQDVSYVNVRLAHYIESYVLYACEGRAYTVVYDEDGQGAWTDVTQYTDLGGKATEAGEAYIRITSFNGNVSAEFALAAQQYKADGADTLLLDLRNNGGGFVSDMQTISSYFLKGAEGKQAVMYAEYKNGNRISYYSGENLWEQYFAGSKIYAAANRNTASASEALLGVLVDFGVLEEGHLFITDTTNGAQAARTYGKGIMQSTYYNFFTGEAAKLTCARVLWPSGRCIHDVGITTEDPVATASPARSYAEYGDPELDAILAAI